MCHHERGPITPRNRRDRRNFDNYFTTIDRAQARTAEAGTNRAACKVLVHTQIDLNRRKAKGTAARAQRPARTTRHFDETTGQHLRWRNQRTHSGGLRQRESPRSWNLFQKRGSRRVSSHDTQYMEGKPWRGYRRRCPAHRHETTRISARNMLHEHHF